MLGMKFQIPNEYGMFLSQIFYKINFENYNWNIEEAEVLSLSPPATDFFLKEKYSNEEFSKVINSSQYYTISLNLQLFNGEKTEKKIDNYSDFLNSNCLLVLLITDNIYVELYSKNREVLEKIKENIKSINFTNIKSISEENEIREKFSTNY